MQTKLTLRLDGRVIQEAKRFAKKRGLSLSQLVMHYFSILNKTAAKADKPVMPISHSLRGVLKKSRVSERDYKKFLEDKYL